MEYITIVLLCFVVILQLAMMFLIVSSERENRDKMEKMIMSNSRSIEKLQEGNEKKLDEMRRTVDEKLDVTLTSRLNNSFSAVSKQLENVYRSLGEMKELSAGVTDNVSALNRVLTNVKARGTWAEVQLRAILDQTVPGMYDCNVKTSPFSADLVEFAVKIPSKDEPGKYAWLPVDSKFPMESYIRLCTASENADAAAADAARKELERAVLNEGKKITKYINEPLTTPFAIMYLATEGLYAEIVSSKQGIAEKLTNEMNVMVAGPTTVTALLNTIAMGFRAAAVNEKASEVRKLLITARVQYEKFGETLDRARSKMDDAAKAIDDASKRNDIIKTKLKNAGEIEAGSLKQKEFISDEEAYAAEETLEEDAASKFNE